MSPKTEVYPKKKKKNLSVYVVTGVKLDFSQFNKNPLLITKGFMKLITHKLKKNP